MTLGTEKWHMLLTLTKNTNPDIAIRAILNMGMANEEYEL